MPNWCEGSLKVRGTVEKLKRFCFENLQPVDYFGNSTTEFTLNSFGNVDFNKICYIRGTRRGFADSCYCEMSEYKNNETAILLIKARFAWGISSDELLEICKKYSVDMKIYAFEQGMEFNLDIEIVNGKIIKNVEIHFQDYRWECIAPELGG